MTPTAPAALAAPTTSGAVPASPDPLREAAQQLHRQFVSEMLKHAKLTDALGAEDTGASLGGALASVALDRIAADVAAGQPALTDSLYQALRRTEADATGSSPAFTTPKP